MASLHVKLKMTAFKFSENTLDKLDALCVLLPQKNSLYVGAARATRTDVLRTLINDRHAQETTPPAPIAEKQKPVVKKKQQNKKKGK